MIQRNLLFIFMVVAAITLIGSCMSKPTTSSDDETITINDTEIQKIVQQPSVNEILLSDNKIKTSAAAEVAIATNSISDKDLDYRTKYAEQMLSYMNRSVYPCEDFYEYACGNWKNVIQERQGDGKRSNVLDISYKLNDLVEELLQRNDIDDFAPEYTNEFELAKQFYQNCLNAKLYPMHQSPEYLEVLQQIGGFPAVNSSWSPDSFSWLNMSAHLSNYGVENLINEDIVPEYPFPAYFKTPTFGFDIELHYDNIENMSSNAYTANEKRMRDILTLYGVEENRLAPLINDIFDFIKEILKVVKQFNEDDDECKALSGLLEESETEEINEQWFAYFDIAWNGKGNYTAEDEDEPPCCQPCAFLYQKLNTICNDHKEAVANYLSLKFLYHMDARLKEEKFQKDHCVSTVRSSMKYLIDHLYMKFYFNDEIRNDVTAIIKEIRQALRKILREADWLDEETREAALLKESKIVEYFGRYEDCNVTDRLIGETKYLQFVEGSFEANYLNLRKFEQYMKRFNGLHYEELSDTSKPLQLLVGMQVNAFYYNIDNAIFLMAGQLMTPVYHKLWPNSLKFGTLGYSVGHEFTHGFDTTGANYDETGSDFDWWSPKSRSVFEERSNCYVDHYDRYFIPEINRYINGNLTKDENIADGGGLREALMAYRRYFKHLTRNTESISEVYKQEQMPGLDLSPEQLFFLGFAQLWCSSYKEADYWKELSEDHTVDKYRVLGAVSNSYDFANAFNCPLGSKMNPSADKCQVW